MYLMSVRDGIGQTPWSFYPRDAMLARVLAIATCLSVRLGVCLTRAGVVPKRRKLMISSPSSSPMILVF